MSQSVGNLASQPTGAWAPAVRKSISCIDNQSSSQQQAMQSINLSASQTNRQSVSQPESQSQSWSFSQSVNRGTMSSCSQAVNQSVNQLHSQPVFLPAASQPNSYTVRQSVSQPESQSVSLVITPPIFSYQTGYNLEGQTGQTQAKKAKGRAKSPNSNNLSSRKTIGVKTIEMCWWWWW